MEEKYKGLKLAERGTHVSIAVYFALSALKLVIGYYSGSKALTADGLNNTTDIVASLAVLIGLRIARKPADENHPYGHFRAETIASLVASLIMITVGLDVLYNAARSVIIFTAEAPDLISAAAAIFSSLLMYLVYRYNKNIAIITNSSGLMAAARDNLSDAWVGIGTAIGITASQFNLPWIDPAAAAVVGILIIRTGWSIFREATQNLTDGFSRDRLDNIAKRIQRVPGVKNVRNIRARVHGNNILIDIIVTVNENLSVVEGHNITEAIEERLKMEFDITEAIVHVEPDL